MKKMSILMTSFVLVATLCQMAFSQVQFKAALPLTIGTVHDTLYVGVSGDGPGGTINDNTYGLDETGFGPLGSYGESSAPPGDPDGNRIRFMDIPNHTEIAAGGYLYPCDFRGFSSPTQVDTFAMRIDGARVEASGATISWPSNLNTCGTSWRLYSRSGSTLTEVANMLTSSSYTFAANNPLQFAIIKVGALGSVPVPGPTFNLSSSSLNFGTIAPGSNALDSVTVTNSGSTNALNISSVVAPVNYVVLPAYATIAAGGSQIFRITFTAPSTDGTYSGNVVFTHNAPGSPSNVSVTGTVQSQGGMLALKGDQDVLDNSNADGGAYKDTIQFVNYSGQPLKGVTFDLVSRGKVTMTPLKLVGSFSPDSNKWTMTTNTVRGRVLADGSSIDTIHAVLLATGTEMMYPAAKIIVATFGYNTANIDSVTASTSIELRNVNGAAVNSSGWPIAAGLNVSYIQNITITNRTKWGDINGDDQVDILDLILLTNHLAKKITLKGDSLTRADIAPWTVGQPAPSPNGILDIQDLVMLQNIILTGKYPSGSPMMKIAAPVIIASKLSKSSSGTAVVTFYVTSKGITIRTECSEDVAGLQVDLTNVISTPTKIISPFSNPGYRLDNNVLRVVLVDQNAKTLSAGSHTIATIPMSIMNLNEIGVANLKVGSTDAQLLSSEAVVTNSQAPDDNQIPTDFALNQNYPNPFNPSTIIKFSIPQTSPVHITVYNMLGQQIRTLFSGVMEAGVQTVTFDGKDQSGKALSSGTYMYRMTAGTFVQTKKMMLLK
jgi:hypothetical protein